MVSWITLWMFAAAAMPSSNFGLGVARLKFFAAAALNVSWSNSNSARLAITTAEKPFALNKGSFSWSCLVAFGMLTLTIHSEC